MRLRTANNNRRRAHRDRVLIQARVYDYERFRRLQASGTLHKRANSYYVRKMRRG